MLRLHCCTDFSLVVASRGYSVTELHRLLIAEASLVSRASVVVANGLGSCGSWALEHRLGSCVHGLSCSLGCGVFLAGIEPTSLTLAGGFFTKEAQISYPLLKFVHGVDK